jgi:NAD(P) transhydrogenase
VQVRSSDGELSQLSADIILIATGSSPYHPPDVPFDHHLIFDSDSILRMGHIPQRMAVIGGGVIGCEYACIFTALGVGVTLIDTRDRLLPHVDREIADRLLMQLEQLGLRSMLNTKVRGVRIIDQCTELELDSGECLPCEVLLYAAGRTGNVEELGLDDVGVQVGDRGRILVNEKFQTSVPNIYAAGDVIGFPALASTSMEQARVAMVHAFDLKYKEQVSPILPFAIYTIPEIAMAGLTEEDCIAQKIPYLVGCSYYDKSPRGQIIGDEAGMLKLIFSPLDKRLLGVHHIGEMSSELVHIGMHVLSAGGPIDAFIHAVYNYPSLSDSYKYAAYDGLGNLEKWQHSQG